MKILIAIDSFKGSLSSPELADCVENGIRATLPDAITRKVTIADGGEGTVEALVRGTEGEKKSIQVTGPLGEKRMAEYGIIHGDTAVIEMAAASGLPLVPEKKRDPWVTTSYGTGELIRAALDDGCRKIIMGIGGSATNDGGAGMAQALGISFTDAKGKELGFGGGALADLSTISLEKMTPQLRECEFVIASDVSNPLCGPEGASAIYGPQKGATPEMITRLDRNLAHFGTTIGADCGKEIMTIPGSGAAGGLAIPLLAYASVDLRPGIDIIFETIQFEQYMEGIDLVITGEGRIDKQSVFGKVPVGVARVAKQKNIPVIAVVGGEGEGAVAVYDYGIDAVVPIPNAPISLTEAMTNSRALVTAAAERIGRLLRIGMRL